MSIATVTPRRLPIVRYLRLDAAGAPSLWAERCSSCGARYFDRRLACAGCGGRAFTEEPLPSHGRLGTFTIVHRATPGIATPYVSGVVYLDDGTAVRTNVVGCDPTPDAVRLGMPVRLCTYVAGIDVEGTEAVAFAFEPVPEEGSDGPA